jgi:hypothetical protein
MYSCIFYPYYIVLIIVFINVYVLSQYINRVKQNINIYIYIYILLINDYMIIITSNGVNVYGGRLW